MLFPDLAISDDYQSSHIEPNRDILILYSKILLSPISIRNMYIEHSLISGMPIFIFWSNI